jgi:hypothetical protein
MKKLYIFLFVIAALLSADNLYSQYASPVTQFPFITGPAADGAPMCVGGLVYNDSTWEDGYGWGPNFGTGKWVMKFTPLSYPWTMNQFCIALTRQSSGPSTWTFDIEIWDTTGAGDSPGTLVHSITNQTVTGIPIWPSVQWFDFYVSGVPALQNGSYYIGISYEPSGAQYVAADQSTTTPLRPGYGYIQEFGWSTIQYYFPFYRAMGIRVDGEPVFAHDIAVGPFLGLQSFYQAGTPVNIKARVRNLGTTNETGVPVKFFVDITQAGSTLININAGVTDSVSFPWTPSSYGYHTLRIFSQLSTDSNRANDTVTTIVQVLPFLPHLTICRNGLNKNLLDYSWVYDTVTVSVPSYYLVIDVNVKVDTLIHTWDEDVSGYLWHGGIGCKIINRVGGSCDNFIGTLLDDSATTPLSSGSAPFTGSFKPSNPLSVFNGYANNPNGNWIIAFSDTAGGDTGFLKAWCLILTFYIIDGGIKTITIPSYYALKQNYPNPFNPSTKIEYYLPKTGNVKLTIFDLLGKEVTVLVNGLKNPGIYTVDFDASRLSSGVYFYRMEAGSFADTKKMLLLK